MKEEVKEKEEEEEVKFSVKLSGFICQKHCLFAASVSLQPT